MFDSINLKNASYVDRVTNVAKTGGNIRIYGQAAFEVSKENALRNVPNRVYKFVEGTIPDDANGTLLGDVSNGAFAVWLLPVAAHKYINAVVRDGTDAPTMLAPANLLIRLCSPNDLETILANNATRANVLTALTALPNLTAISTESRFATGSLVPRSVAYIITAATATTRLINLHLEVYGNS